MKKFLLLALFVFTLQSCELESDDPGWLPELVRVTDIELPEFFEEGKSYDIEVTYVLPTACHIPQGINASREALYGSGRRKIYVAGIAAKKFGEPVCQEESDDLEKTGSFRLVVDEDMPYTFFLWTGIDEAGKDLYTEIEVPVGEPTTETQE
ncbi:hypothetical protein HC174_09750 [Salinimicrobium sp. CDJ15-81-2]|nr:hypothetical protein [Salinimicrobium nanhaiense]